MLDYCQGFEILIKYKEAIRQLIKYTGIDIPTIIGRYKLSYSLIRRVLNYKALERARLIRTSRPRILNGPQIRWIIAYVSSSWEYRILNY